MVGFTLHEIVVLLREASDGAEDPLEPAEVVVAIDLEELFVRQRIPLTGH